MISLLATSIPLFANPWLHGVAAGGFVATLIMAVGDAASWWERKFSARLQNRRGPTELGPFGFFIFIADVIKPLQKEESVPADADAPLYRFAPWLPPAIVLATAAVVPLGGTSTTRVSGSALR